MKFFFSIFFCKLTVNFIGNLKDFILQDSQNGKLDGDHLPQLLSRLGPAISNLLPIFSSTTPTILGMGTQSLLRTNKGINTKYIIWRSPRKSGSTPKTTKARDVCHAIIQSSR